MPELKRGAERGRPHDSVAPPPQSLRPPAIGAPVAAREGIVPAGPRSGTSLVPTAALAAFIVLAGAADFVLFAAHWSSVVAAAVLSILVVPWGALVLRPEVEEAGRPGRRKRLLVFHWVNAALVAAFTFAKWSVASGALRGGALHVGPYRTYATAVVLLLLLGLALRGGRIARLAELSTEHPARLMAVSFGTASVLGALLLALPICLRDVGSASLLDSLFMSISAVCVTGLTTVNVAETYTFTGQLVLCVLMQIGGLGIMALTAAVTMLAGQRMGMKRSAVLAEMVDAGSLADLKRTLRAIVLYTLVFEAAGAALLYVQFDLVPELSETASAPGPMAGPGSALWAAVFHSVSAFCNGSLSNFRGGLVPFAGYPGICQTLSVLIVLGGLGFPVIHELTFRAHAWLRRMRPRRMSLNTRVALLTSAVLLVVMAIAYLALESSASFRRLSIASRINAAIFQSACARTSGFNLVDVAEMRPATLLLTSFAMFVGAGPGSTGGGIKTTTLAVLFASYRGELRNQRARLFDRTIPEAVVRRAVGVAFLSIVVICAVVFVLSVLEPFDTLALFFEAVSAFSTTGLSTGITPSLSGAGKLLVGLTMLFGRIGPLTVALALSARGRPAAVELAEERVMIG
jgi:trk system potassium uptake protein TrkH